MGYVDFERVYGLDGVGIANVVDLGSSGADDRNKVLKSKITFDDARHWEDILVDGQSRFLFLSISPTHSSQLIIITLANPSTSTA